jgi:hypothetical protein
MKFTDKGYFTDQGACHEQRCRRQMRTGFAAIRACGTAAIFNLTEKLHAEVEFE